VGLALADNNSPADTNAPMPDIHFQSLQLTPDKEAALKQLTKMYDARDKLTDCSFGYLSVTSEMDGKGRKNPYTVSVSGVLHKPNKFNITLYHTTQLLAQVISDGVTETYYNPKTHMYAQFPVLPNYDIGYSLSDADTEKLKAIEVAMKLRKPDTAKSDDMDITQDPEVVQDQAKSDAMGVLGDLAAPETASVSGTEFLLRKTTPAEQDALLLLIGTVKHLETHYTGFSNPVEVVELGQKTTVTGTNAGHKEVSGSTTKMHLAFDSVSGFPIEARLEGELSIGGHTISTPIFNFAYFSIAPVAAPYPDGTFTWTPPAGAKPYHSPNKPFGLR